MYNDNLKSKLYTFLLSRMNLKVSTNGFLRGDCPYCEGRFTFGVNFEKGKSNCFRCSEGKNRLTVLAMYLANVNSFKELIPILAMEDDYNFVFQRHKPTEISKKQIELPDSYRRLDFGDKSNYYSCAKNYLVHKRGLNYNLLVNRGIGYGTEGEFYGYLIFPYFTLGELTYYTTRRFIGSGKKFNNPSESQFGVGKSSLIYNQDALLMYRTVSLVESVTNALTIGERGCALGGKDCSDYQTYLILKSPVQNINLILDPDATQQQVELGLKLIEYKRVRPIYLSGNKDVNQLGRKLIKNLISKETYTTRKDLLNYLWDLKK